VANDLLRKQLRLRSGNEKLPPIRTQGRQDFRDAFVDGILVEPNLGEAVAVVTDASGHEVDVVRSGEASEGGTDRRSDTPA